MPRYDFKCVNSHVTELTCSHDEIPEVIVCRNSDCNMPAKRYYGGMGIYSTCELGTGGGINMQQRKDDIDE